MIDQVGVGSASLWAGLRVLVLSPTPTYPLDCGNRRRIYFVCRRIKQLGGEIHFLHYPSEEQWAVALPIAEQRRMIAEWDAYYVAPVTRELYAPAREADHAIDDWWDPGIGDMLNWLFRVQTFDVFIVNYAWLSKAFEYAPAGVVKIIDTHDRFAERRVIFEAHGLVPDYFHIAEDDERRALERADVVWAIKPEEEVLFRRISKRRVLTLLHAEPVVTGWPRIRNGTLRFGITGSANEFNIANFRNFLTVATDYVRQTLLPCEIVLAGACCDRLGDLNYPFIRQMGRVERIEDFYDAVDVVLGPMEFSTGLKIRIGEALSRAKAVVAHRHCFEGYAAAHSFHTLPSFEAMMQACRDIVRTPQLIDDLELASVESMTRALQSVGRTLEATLAGREETLPKLVFVLDSSEVWEGSLALDHLFEAAQYVAHQCPVEFFLDGPAGQFEPRSLSRLGRLGRVTVSPEAAAALGWQPGAGAPLHARVASFEELLRSRRLGFWFGSFPRRLPVLSERIAVPAFVPIPVLALRVAEPHLRQSLATLDRTFAEVVAMDLTRSPLLDAAARRGAATHVVPILWCTDLSEALKSMAGAERQAVTFFTPRPDGALFELAFAVARNSTGRPIEFVYDDRSAGGRRAPAPSTAATSPRLVPLSVYAKGLGRGGMIPALVVELGRCSAFDALCELMDRGGVPRLSLFDGGAPRPLVAGRAPDRVTGVMESAIVLADWLRDEARFAELAERGRRRYRALDPGWTIIWDFLTAIVARGGQGPAILAEASETGRREIGAEIVLHIERQDNRRYPAQGWIGNRGAPRPGRAGDAVAQ
jgi:hypothetical protein